MDPSGEAIIWRIGSKFSGRNLEVALPATVIFHPPAPAPDQFQGQVCMCVCVCVCVCVRVFIEILSFLNNILSITGKRRKPFPFWQEHVC